MDDVKNYQKRNRRRGCGCPSSSCFSVPTSPSKIDNICEGFVPINTQKATGWECCVFEERRAERNKSAKEKWSLMLLEDPCVGPLNNWPSCFVVEMW